jgi:flagellar basal body-associated protein FliL
MSLFRVLRKKAQGLPMETIVIIVLVVLVLAAVGYIFFVYTTGGQAGFSQANTTASAGMGNFTTTTKPWG